MQKAFGTLPAELFLNVLDQLVGTRNGKLPIAYELSHPVTKALRALTLVTRTVYLVASRYLYNHCIYLQSANNLAYFRRTLGIDLGSCHPLVLEHGQAGRNEKLFNEADIPRHVTALFISPAKAKQCIAGSMPQVGMPLVRLPQIIELCLSIGSTLKRLAIDFNPVYVPASEQVLMKPYCSSRNIFLHMPNLEELVCSYETLDYFRYPPPNLKRMAMTANDIQSHHLEFYFMQSSLEALFFIRPKELSAVQIDELFSKYKGRHLDIVFVDVNSHHLTPRNTRDWTPEDTVMIWEADVPTSFYGDDDDLVLSDNWIWTHGVKGDLWEQEKRRMRSWSEVERSLTGTP